MLHVWTKRRGDVGKCKGKKERGGVWAEENERDEEEMKQRGVDQRMKED